MADDNKLGSTINSTDNSTDNSTENGTENGAGSSKVQIVRVQEAQHGQRINNFLIRHLKGVPRSRVYRLIRRGEVRLNKKRCKPDRKLQPGDQIRIPPYSGVNAEASIKVSPGLRRLLLDSVLCEGKDFLVLDKLAGLAVHGGSGIRLGLLSALRQLEPERLSR